MNKRIGRNELYISLLDQSCAQCTVKCQNKIYITQEGKEQREGQNKGKQGQEKATRAKSRGSAHHADQCDAISRKKNDTKH